ncbi:hypothetical protein [Nitrobacter sp. Nb-311A]|uniref:hypothetical protein n=1 Tax=Nitrobacter sp. Nb-311A TaxID=314253 RepID=UPI001FDA18EB|nr:hypothetical protein [Nitrobacter sp. Nb-311A]
MASRERIFFAGVATSALLIGIGFGGGILLGQAALEPTQQAPQPKLATRSLPPARVVLPAPTEAAPSLPASSSAPLVQAATPAEFEPQRTSSQDDPARSQKADQVRTRDLENQKQAERRAKVEKKNVEAAERRKKAAERHRRYAEKKARQEAALEQRALEQRQEARKRAGPFGLLAFDDGAESPRPASFFGN